MPVSKNTRIKRTMKPREFKSVKSARRFLNRFRWKIAERGVDLSKKLKNTVQLAIKIINDNEYNGYMEK